MDGLGVKRSEWCVSDDVVKIGLVLWFRKALHGGN